jgi:hypothetical protein
VPSSLLSFDDRSDRLRGPEDEVARRARPSLFASRFRKLCIILPLWLCASSSFMRLCFELAVVEGQPEAELRGARRLPQISK